MYPLVMTNIAIENGHRNSGFSHEKWVDLSIAMLNNQRVHWSFEVQNEMNVWLV